VVWQLGGDMNYPHIPADSFDDSIVKDVFQHYILHHTIIDQQHLEIYTDLCNIRDAAIDGYSDSEIDMLVDRVVERVKTHVATEARIMISENYEYTDSHLVSNSTHVKDIQSIKHNHDPAYITFIINEFLNHIDYTDRIMVNAIRKDRTRRKEDTHVVELSSMDY